MDAKISASLATSIGFRISAVLRVSRNHQLMAGLAKMVRISSSLSMAHLSQLVAAIHTIAGNLGPDGVLQIRTIKSRDFFGGLVFSSRLLNQTTHVR